MSHEKIKEDLNLLIKELNQYLPMTKESKLMTSEISNKISELLDKIVNNFYQILIDLFLNEENLWNFISKHVNKFVTKFCIIYEKNDPNEDEFEGPPFEKKGKNWIFLSILENSFYNSMKEIYQYKENNLMNDVTLINILQTLDEMEFDKIYNEDFQNYLNYLKENELLQTKEEDFFCFSPIMTKRSQNHKDNDDNENFIIAQDNEMDSIYQEYDLNIINIKSEYFDFQNKDSDISLIDLNQKNKKNYQKSTFYNKIEKPEEFEFKKAADLGPSIVDNFYTFIPKIKSRITYDDGQDSNIIISSVNEEEFGLNNHLNNCDTRKDSGLKLYTKENFRHLPSDELYEKKDSNYDIRNDYINKNKKRPKNSLILYLNYFYKKVDFFKFETNNFAEKSIILKEQNYQCYICLKKFSHFFNIPLEGIYWCSYYMRFVCKECIAEEYSIIPQFILKEWCFDKFPISKKAKDLIYKWYEKPIIYLKQKEDKEIIKKIPEEVLRLKKKIRRIFNYMKCEDAFDFIEKKIPDYKYILLKEKIFSLKDLIDMHNSSKFIQKLKKIEEILLNHINNECNECKYEGEYCLVCQSEEKIYFYDTKNIFYCHSCSKSFHKECLTLEHHNH